MLPERIRLTVIARTLRRGPVLAVTEIRGEGAGDRGHDGVAGDDQPEFAVLVEGGAGEVLRTDEDLPVVGAVVGLDYLAMDVEAGGGAVVADADPGPGQPGERAVVLAALVLPADPDVDAAPGRLDERVLHGPVAHLLAVDAQAARRAVDEAEQPVLRVG